MSAREFPPIHPQTYPSPAAPCFYPRQHTHGPHDIPAKSGARWKISVVQRNGAYSSVRRLRIRPGWVVSVARLCYGVAVEEEHLQGGSEGYGIWGHRSLLVFDCMGIR
ncbi:hypothetical protein BDW68DRAFT_54890 [Aspergillus falconensis]